MDPLESAGKARRRRRLSSIGVAVPGNSSNSSVHAFDDVDELHHHAETPAVTPRKKKKKKQVRFSEPGPDTTSSSSTGLTPAIRRQTLLSSTPSLLREPPKRLGRRKSMPARLSSADASSPTKTLQFAPLRQVLDGRVTRRLKRNHLSEEINTIAKEKRDQARCRKLEVELLKQEIAEKNRALEDLENELRTTRQLANESGFVHDGMLSPEETMQALKKEVADLKEEITRREEHSNKTPSKGDFTIMSNIDHDDNDDDLMHMSIDDFDANMTDVRDASPCRSRASSAASPNTTRQLVTSSAQTAADADLSCQLATLQSALQSLAAKNEYLQTTCQRAATKLSPFIPPTTSASDDDATTLDAALDSVLTNLALSQSDSIATRSALTTLSTAVTSLGFPGDSPPAMLATMQAQFREARLVLERLEPGEIVQAFDNPTLLSLLLTRLQTLYPTLAALRDKDATTTSRLESGKKEHYAAERRAIHAEQAQTAASATAASLIAEVKEKEHSILRLQGALDGYRREVSSLEALVTRLDGEHAAQRRAADEAVADLHDTAAERLALLATLGTNLAAAQATAQEVQQQSAALLAQKDALSREVDAKACLVTARNSRIQRLSEEVEGLRADLAAANTEANSLTGTVGMLEGRLEREREASQSAIREVQEEVMRAISRLASTGRGCSGPCEEAAMEGDVGGWLPETPTSLKFASSSAVGSSPVRREGRKEVRFGGVTEAVGKKRKRWDSGIGVDSDFELPEEDVRGEERDDVVGVEASSPLEV